MKDDGIPRKIVFDSNFEVKKVAAIPNNITAVKMNDLKKDSNL